MALRRSNYRFIDPEELEDPNDQNTPTLPEPGFVGLKPEMRSPFASLGAMTSFNAIQDFTQPAPALVKQDTIQDVILKILQQGPQYESYPEPPKPSVLSGLKQFGKSFIPGYDQQVADRRDWEEGEVKRRNLEAAQRYQQGMEIAKPIILRQYDEETNQRELARRTGFLMRAYGLSQDQAEAYGGGFPPLPVKQLPQSVDVVVKLPDGSTVSGFARDDANGVRRIYTMDGKLVAPAVAAQSEIYRPRSAPLDQRDRVFDEEQRFAQALQDAAEGKQVDPALLSGAKARQAWNAAKQPPPGYQIRDTAEGAIAVNPRTLETRGVQAPGGGPIRTKLSEADKKVFDRALEWDSTLAQMIENARAGEKGSAQADVALLFQHMAMTIGKVKGARLNKAEIERAISARPILQGIYAKYTAGVKGPFLSPEQRIQMIELGHGVREKAWAEARKQAKIRSIPADLYPSGASDLPPLPEDFSGLSDDELKLRTLLGDDAADQEWARRFEEKKKVLAKK